MILSDYYHDQTCELPSSVADSMRENYLLRSVTCYSLTTLPAALSNRIDMILTKLERLLREG